MRERAGLFLLPSAAVLGNVVSINELNKPFREL
jgi:hypothetical protein